MICHVKVWNVIEKLDFFFRVSVRVEVAHMIYFLFQNEEDLSDIITLIKYTLHFLKYKITI